MALTALFIIIQSALFVFTSGLRFECNFRTSDWTVVGNVYTCQAVVVHSGSENSLEQVIGVHLEGKSNDDVEFLLVSSQVLNHIPEGIIQFFPNLKAIRWNHSKLLSITAEDLKPFPNLIYFASWGNEISALDGDVFKYTKSLRYLQMFVNQLEHVGHDLLTDLSDLQFVNFNSNPCIKVVASTTQTIHQLNEQLPLSCPPLEASKKIPSECSAKCLEYIEMIETELVELSARNSELSAQIEKLHV